jgi:hypothetical protein
MHESLQQNETSAIALYWIFLFVGDGVPPLHRQLARFHAPEGGEQLEPSLAPVLLLRRHCLCSP